MALEVGSFILEDGLEKRRKFVSACVFILISIYESFVLCWVSGGS